MNEKTTSDLRDKRSFEERVLARFDALDVRFDSIDARFDSIEARLEKLEARNLDTKPIWERALKAIMDTGLEVGEIRIEVGAIKSKVESLDQKVDSLDQKVDKLEVRLGTVESDLAAMRIDYAGLHDQLIKSQSDFKKKMTRRIDMVLETVVDTHENMRDYDERLNRLESKLA